jgi:hypothetical protein
MKIIALASTTLFSTFAMLTACSSNTGNNPNDGGNGQGPAAATVTVADSCPAATPCGGAPSGTWDYTGGCAELGFDSLKQSCPSLTITNTSATVTARVIFTSANVSRSYTANGKATVHVPAACAQPAGGCTVLQSEIQSGGNTATCTDDGSSGCNCDVTGTSSDTSSDTYTVQGDTIVTGDGNEYAFCIQGGTMTYSHTSGTATEHGAFTLTKR